MSEVFKWFDKFTFGQTTTILILFIILLFLWIVARFLGLWISKWKEKRDARIEEKKKYETLGLTGKHVKKTKLVYEFPSAVRVMEKRKFELDILALIQKIRDFPSAEREVILDLTNVEDLNSNASVGFINIVKDVMINNVVKLRIIIKKRRKRAYNEIMGLANIANHKSVEIVTVDK